MSMFRLILMFVLFYFLFKVVKMFVRFFIPEAKKPSNFNSSPAGESKYKDVEEVEFKEIKEDTQNQKDESNS